MMVADEGRLQNRIQHGVEEGGAESLTNVEG